MEFDADKRSRPKRPAEDDLENEQRLTKRMGRLRIDPSHNWPIATVPPLSPNHAQRDHMSVDETKDRIYIHDLDSELAELEEQEPEIAYLPEIEKKLAALPTAILGTNSQEGGNKQMVLYQVPSSISVPEEQDHVRRAIIAARTRARETPVSETSVFAPGEDAQDQPKQSKALGNEGADAMDID